MPYHFEQHLIAEVIDIVLILIPVFFDLILSPYA